MARTSSAALDELDREILNELNINARQSAREVAKRLDISPTTVVSRLRELEEQQVIQGFIPVLDDEKLGWDLWAVIGVWISKGKLREAEERIAQDPRAYAIYDVTGDNDAVIIGRFRDRRDLDRFVKHILQDPYVERSNTQVVLNRVKEDRRVPVILKSQREEQAAAEAAASAGATDKKRALHRKP